MNREKIIVETEYDPQKHQYHIVSITGGVLPKRRWFDSHAEAIEAAEKSNPGKVTA